MKKLVFVIVAMMMAVAASAQHDIKLVVSGQGATKEVATANALRSAVEQAFGTFVSANTQILNDEITKAEIATISSGNIKEYHELGCVTLPGGDQFVTLAATVSLSNLISYSKSKGSTAEFAGAAFAMNIRMRKLNAENEITALYNMLEQLYILAPSVFDWELEVRDPAVVGEQKYEVPMIAKAKINSNTSSFFSLLFNTLESLCLSPSEAEAYKANKMAVYCLKVNNREFIFRNDYRDIVTYVKHLINCIGESFHIYGQFGDKKKKLLYSLKEKYLARMKREYYRSYLYTFEIENLDTFMNEAPGSIAFQRDLSVSLDENALYQLYGFEVVPAPNISRMTFVCENRKMYVDTMNVYQSVDIRSDWDMSDSPCREALKQIRVLYVSEDCLVDGDDIRFFNQDNLEMITVERLLQKDRGPVFSDCDNLETVRIGEGMKYLQTYAFNNNPSLSTVIIGSTLTYGKDVIDLMSLTEKELQNIVIIGDGVSINPDSFGVRAVSKECLSVVLNRDVRNFKGRPSAKFAVWLNASSWYEFSFHHGDYTLIFVPQKTLYDFQNYYIHEKFSPLEDRVADLECGDLLSFLKTLCQDVSQENISQNMSQNNVVAANEEPIPWQLLDETPSFQGGGVNTFIKWVRDNLIYPEMAKENGVQGRVVVQAIISADGSLTDLKIIRGCDPSLDKEALRVTSLSPKWKPGTQNGRAVPTICTFTVTFQL